MSAAWNTGHVQHPTAAASGAMPELRESGAGDSPAEAEIGGIVEPASGVKKGFGSRVGRYTFHYHRRFTALQGVVQGWLAPTALGFIAIKQLGDGLSADAQKTYTTLISWFPSLVMVTAPFWHQDRLGIKSYLRKAAIYGKLLPLLLFAFVTEPWQVVVLITLSTLLCAGVPPAQNALLGSNYEPCERERYYGLAKLWMIPLFMAANFAFMEWMDNWGSAYRVVLPLCGVIGFISLYTLRKVKMRRPITPAVKFSTRMPRADATRFSKRAGRIAQPWRNAVKLQLRDRNFGLYELGFMSYGMAFMMMLPVVPNYYDKVFPDVGFAEYSLHVAVAFQGTTFLTHLLLRGRHSGWSPARIAGTAFGLLALYPTMLLLGEQFHNLNIALCGFLIFGIGMTLVDYAWSLGPIRFAKGGDATPYVSAHTMMVGVRAFFAFPLSLLVMIVSDNVFWPVLSVAIAFCLIGMMCNVWLGMRLRGAAGDGMWVKKTVGG